MAKFILAATILSVVSAHDTSKLVLYEDYLPDQQYAQTNKIT